MRILGNLENWRHPPRVRRSLWTQKYRLFRVSESKTGKTKFSWANRLGLPWNLRNHLITLHRDLRTRRSSRILAHPPKPPKVQKSPILHWKLKSCWKFLFSNPYTGSRIWHHFHTRECSEHNISPVGSTKSAKITILPFLPKTPEITTAYTKHQINRQKE